MLLSLDVVDSLYVCLNVHVHVYDLRDLAKLIKFSK